MQRRVLILGNFLSGAGGSRGVCEDLSERLRRVGWGVVTASSFRNRPCRMLDMCGTVWTARRRYDVAQIDVFSGPAFLWAEWSGRLLARLGKPFVLALRGGDLPRFAHRSPERVRRFLRMSQEVLAPSGYLADALSFLGVPVSMLPNPIELDAYPYVRRERPAPRLVWLRAIHNIYNPVLAPRVVERLTGEFPEMNLVMAGPDKGDGSFERLNSEIRTLGLEGRIRLLGGVAKKAVPEVLRGGDIFLNTTDVDNSPVSVLEAMACGLCVVSTNVGGIPFLIENEKDGLVVGRNDAEAMAGAVRRILTEPGLAVRISENARRKAEGCDWRRVLPQWEDVLLRAAGAKGRRVEEAFAQ